MAPIPDDRLFSIFKTVLFTLCLLPLSRLLWAGWTGDFGPEPEELVQRWSGIWTLNLLLITLCVSPLRAITQMHWLLRLRRMLGLFCFFYAVLHFLAFIGFSHHFDVTEIATDIVKRPFIAVGLVAFVLLIPLAASSSNRAIRQLGGRQWQDLHRSIYLIGILAAIHYCWQSKASALLWPLAYAVALAALLAWRARERRRKAVVSLPQKLQSAKPLKFFKQRPD